MTESTYESVLYRPSAANDVARLSYEQAREELVAVVQRLEAGQVPLKKALDL